MIITIILITEVVAVNLLVIIIIIIMKIKMIVVNLDVSCKINCSVEGEIKAGSLCSEEKTHST